MKQILVALTVAVLIPSCQSTPTTENKRTLDPAVSTTNKTLSDLDLALQIWNNALLSEPSEQTQSQIQAAALALETETKSRFEEFSRLVDSGPMWQRTIATAAIGFSKDERALPFLMRALNDSESRIVGNALISIGVLGSKSTPTDPLIEILNHHPNSEVRNDAAFALKKLSEVGVDNAEMKRGLRDALKDSEPGVRAQAATALGHLKDSESIETLIGLLGDNKPLIASASAFALGKIKDPKATGALISALESPSPRVRESAHLALVEITGQDKGKSGWDWKKP